MKAFLLLLFGICSSGCAEVTIDKNMSGYEIVSFNTTLKSLEVSKLDDDKLIRSFPLENMELINPFIIGNESNNYISMIEFAPNGELILDLETGKVVRKQESYGTYIINDSLRFYFEPRQEKSDVLVRDLNGHKKIIHSFKKSSVSKPKIASDGSVSWFFRREHSLVVYNQEGNVNVLKLPDCRDAIWLGSNDEILCINEQKGMSKVNVNNVNTILNDDLTFSVISTDFDNKEVYLSSITTSLAVDSFMTEFHDIYIFDLQTNTISLLKEKAIMHGKNYFVRKSPTKS